MEENRICHFKAKVDYTLPVHKEFMRINIDISKRNNALGLFFIAYMIFIAFYFDGRSFASIFLLGSTVYFVMRIITYLKNKDGGTEYKRLLYQHEGKTPHQILTFEDDGIRCTNSRTGNDQVHPYERVRLMVETKNLLLFMLDLKLCLILDKHSLTGGTKEDLAAFMRAHCPNMKKRVRTGLLGRSIRRILYIILIIGSLIGTAILFDVPAKLSGQISNDMTYLEIAEKLKPLGITGATPEMQEELDEFYSEYYTGINADYYNKATDLLAWVGMGTYDDNTWEWTPASNGVYWLDMEVWDIGCMYTDFLRGISALNPDELSFSEITEDHSGVDYENWTGTVHLSFRLNDQAHEMNIAFDGDWISLDALSEIAEIVQAESSESKLYFASDEGQGILVFYRTPDWAEEFAEITRIPLYENPNEIWYY